MIRVFISIAVPPHSLIRTRCRFLCEFSRRRAEVLWTRACKYLRRPSLFSSRTSHPSISFHAARGNVTVHCWNVQCRIIYRCHMTSSPQVCPVWGLGVFRGERLNGLSSFRWSGEALGLDTGCAGGVERSATSSTCFSIYSPECTTAMVQLTKWRIWSQLGLLHVWTKTHFSTLKDIKRTIHTFGQSHIPVYA